jgi:DNA-binding CsgD family transcriptional regulator/type II secretory pathway predicted ATPase ExeA
VAARRVVRDDGDVPTVAPRAQLADAPLTGRDEELETVLRALRERRGAVLSGAAGVGKTRLARAAARAVAAAGGAVEQATATDAAATIPFGAFAAFVPPGGGDLLRTLQAAGAALRDRHDGRPVVLLVDDAHRLDRSSATLLHHLCAQGHATVLATVRAGEPVPDAVTALWKDAGAERVDVAPLADDAAARLAAALAGGPLERQTLRWLLEGARGNPLYLAELLRAARDGGALVERDGRWRRTGAVRPGPRLTEAIDARIGRLAAAEHRALALVALAEPLGLEVLAALGALSAAGELERRGLVEAGAGGAIGAGGGVAGAGGPALRVAHPLFGEVVRGRLGAVEGRTLRAELSAALPRDRPATRLLVAGWALLDDRRDEAELLASACADALAALDPAAAVAFGEAALAAGAGVETVVPLSTALRATERFEEAERLLAGSEEAVRPTPHAALHLFNRAMGLHWGLRRPDQALALLTRAQTWRTEPEWQATVRNVAATLLVTTGRLREGVALAQPLVEAPGLTDTTRLRLGLTLGYALPLAGRPEEGLHALERARAHCRPGATVEWPPEAVAATAAVASGRGWTAAEQALERRRAEALSAGAEETVTWCELSLLRLAAARGEAARARRLAEGALERLTLMDPREHAATCLAEIALAAVEQGDLTGARDALARCRVQLERWPAGLAARHRAALAEAAVATAAGDGEAGRGHALAAADACGEALLLEAEALYVSLRCGGDGRAARLRLDQLAERAPGTVVEAWAEHARAAGDGAALERAARRFEQIGALGWAEAAMSDAAAVYAGAAGTGAAARAQAAAARLAAARRLPESRARAHANLAALRPREREIARLVALGLPNAEIAARLSLSVRTVESHVYRATARLGLRSRRALGEAVSTAVQ